MKRLALIPLVVALVGVFALVACGADEPEEVAKPAPAALAAPAPTALPAVVAPAPKVEPVAVGKTGLAGVVATPAPAAKAMEPAKVEDDRFGGVLKIILAGSLGSVDSTASGSANTRGIAWHVVETLLGWDDAGIIRGDMVDTWKIENDGTKFTFTLRDGLNWHDGTAVDSDDIVASLERWRAFDRRLAPFVNEVWDSSQVIDEKTFQVNLTGPTGILMMGLGFPGGNQANMWPKELIEAHPFGGDPLDSNLNGSGPYKFTTWRPGYQVILDKNYDYVSDTDPPEYRVGAKIGYYDQLDFIEVPEQQTRVAAILTGEVDFLDAISGDFFDKAMDNTDKVKIHVGKPGAMPWITLGPKDEEYDEKSGDGLFYLFSEKGKNMRLAIGAALNAEEVMKAYGPPNMWGLCASYWHCGTFWGEGDFSGGRYNWNDPEESRSLQQLAGYNNEVIHLYDPAGYATITMIPNVIFPQLTAAGLNIGVPRHQLGRDGEAERLCSR